MFDLEAADLELLETIAREYRAGARVPGLAFPEQALRPHVTAHGGVRRQVRSPERDLEVVKCNWQVQPGWSRYCVRIACTVCGDRLAPAPLGRLRLRNLATG
ncbi:hypothetical protein AB3X91_41650 [Paraburkholderia sp. BR14263]|uniref:hypothetical protein n=1 Tax=unclassified Paraburkholderia TaxID=2615204 RepID=UPI0034CF8297